MLAHYVKETQMDFNTILLRLGLDPNCFVNRLNEPIKTDEGFIYEIEQECNERLCIYCKSDNVIIHDHDTVEINCSETDHIKDILRIRKVRFKCKDCKRTFTPSIRGIERYSKTSSQTLDMILKDFHKVISFKDIGIRYSLSTARILQIFDENINYVPRRRLPGIMCIDEIRFTADYNQHYCCVLYDFETGEIVDIIKNRQLAYLNEYFDKIPEKERNQVRVFISDMYDGYATVKRRYFTKALHVVDLFHIINQMSVSVGKIRVKAMNRLDHKSIEYGFMKKHWKLFLAKKENVPDKFYTSRKTGETYHYDDLVFQCVLKDSNLLEAYNTLQDLYRYKDNYYSFKEAYDFVDHISKRLILSDNEDLEKVGRTYRKWIGEITNGLSYSQSGRRYTNGMAESINNRLKTVIKVAYGYSNFERFRKRVLLIITYKKELR